MGHSRSALKKSEFPVPNDARWSPPNNNAGSRLGESLRTNGRPLTTRELARVIGMSPTFIREEIRSGHLHAVKVGRGHRRVFRIAVSEARRYLKELGLM